MGQHGLPYAAHGVPAHVAVRNTHLVGDASRCLVLQRAQPHVPGEAVSVVQHVAVHPVHVGPQVKEVHLYKGGTCVNQSCNPQPLKMAASRLTWHTSNGASTRMACTAGLLLGALARLAAQVAQ